ncbi:MAG TPA: ATP-binding protein [Puia sp.]|nr:ATP-binding protein [Puia sp.]
MLKKIVIIGPESTGKSTLCEFLAQHYKSDWVPEYAREYLMTHGKSYSFDTLLSIARGQIRLEEEHAAALTIEAAGRSSALNSQLLFIDTDMYVMKVWCEFVFNKCHQWIIDQIASREYDMYLLCNTDLPWTQDELREYPDHATREKLFRLYKDILVNQNTPWKEIRGSADQRFQTALSAVDSLAL